MSAPEPTLIPPEPQGPGLKIPILFGLVIALIAATVYLFVQIDRLNTGIAETKNSLLAEIASLRETSNVTSQTAKHRIETLQDELENARRQAAMAAGQAKVDAQKHAEDIARRLQVEQARVTQQVRGEISEVRQTATTATTKIGEVSTEVGAVKTDVASTKSELDKTISDLKRVTGDLGVTSGLVATNGKEIAALKALGERNIFEFKLNKTKQPQRIGDIAIQLRKTDPKRNKFTIEVIADDKKVEKKDKSINEPVQFYVAKARQPYEIVVNDVKKDLIVGYLSTPKVQQSR